MKRHVLFVGLLLSFCGSVVAQNKTLGVGVSTPNSNAALHVESPTFNQGFIMPRLTTGQRTSPGFTSILTAADNGLMVYDTDLKTLFIWDGTKWNTSAQVAGGPKLQFPYKDSIVNATGTPDLFKLQYNNPEGKRLLRLENLNATNGSSVISAMQTGPGIGAFVQINNPTSGGTGIMATTNSNLGGSVPPVAVYGESTGTGASAGSFRINNAANIYSALFAETNGSGPALNANQIGTGPAAVSNIFNPANTATSFIAMTNGTGGAGKFEINNAASTSHALYVQSNADTLGAAIHGNQIGNGFGVFGRSAGSKFATAAVYGEHVGTGDAAGAFRISNSSNTFSALFGETNGSGPALFGNQLGMGRGLQAQIQNASNAQAAIRSFTNGLGRSGFFTINNPSNTSSGIYTETNGTGHALEANQTGTGNGIFTSSVAGAGLFAVSSGATTSAIEAYKTDGGGNSIEAGHNGATTNGNGNAIYGFADGGASNAIKGTIIAGNGHAGFFDIPAGGSGNAVFAITNGSGNAIYAENSGAGNAIGGLFRNTNAGNTYPAIQAETTGAAPAISIIQNPGSAGSGMYVGIQNTATSSPALNINYQGTGTVARIDQNNASNFSAALESMSTGGPSARFNITNVASGSNVLEVATQGTGRAAIFQNLNGSSAQQVVEITGNGAGNNLISTATGTGFAGYFSVNNASSGATAFAAETNGTGRAGMFYSSNASNSSPALQGRSVGIGSGVSGLNTGSGSAGAFDINNSVSSGDALFAATDGTGNSLKLNHTGASGSIAVFQSGGTNVARIGKNGIGYFNGGTQSSGADVAEMFEVEGEVTSYEPGDVLVISQSSDRTVEKSSSSNSTRVAGVYATKPGVKLTERNLDENMDDLVPMGVIGVIPTKVCLENGPIKRGDILVTSSKPGHAMKAVPVVVNGVEIYPTGAILGKALENFDGAEAGKIKVLVNVK
jgi:trimeric autotransporter adhesin